MKSADLILAIGLAVILAAVFASLFDLAPLIAKALVRQAARWWHSDLDTPEQLAEEWQALIEDRPVGVLKMGTGLRFWLQGAARQLRFVVGQPQPKRLLAGTGLLAFIVVFALGTTLDFSVFRSLQPTGTELLPFGLACVAMIGISVGSVLLFGTNRHHLLPESVTPYYRQVAISGGGILAVGIAGYMIMIAPNLSIASGSAHVVAAQEQLAEHELAIPPPGRAVIAADIAAVTQAKAAMAHAQVIGRVSVAALAGVQIPLSEAAVLGGEMLMSDAAAMRRKRARNAHRRARIDLHAGTQPALGRPSFYRLVTQVGVAAFSVVFGTGIMLNYLTFRDMHPTGTTLLPLGLAVAVMTGITAGSLVMFGARWGHRLLPPSASLYFRRTVRVGGGLLALGVIAYVTAIAPNLSIASGRPQIVREEQILRADQTTRPPVSFIVIEADKAAIADAETKLVRSERNDRLTAEGLAFVDIPLSVGALRGGEMLMSGVAAIRRKRARSEKRVRRASGHTCDHLRLLIRRIGRVARYPSSPGTVPVRVRSLQASAFALIIRWARQKRRP